MGCVTNAELYAIGDVARRTGLSVSAIRFYSDEGIVDPSAHTGAGYRLYDIAAVARLELVSTLRELGAGLDEIRRLLAAETTLRDLAATHLEILDQQARRLRVRRAVLRVVVAQRATEEQVALLHRLASMSDADRERLLDAFWDEVTDGLAVDPGYVDTLRRMRPELPADPTVEQLGAWIELADLVGDTAFRNEVRRYLHASFTAPAHELTPEIWACVEKHVQVQEEVVRAYADRMPADSAEARALVERLAVSIAELTATTTGEYDLAGARRFLLDAADHVPAPAAERAVAEFSATFDRFLTLAAAISGGTELDVEGQERWVADALRSGATARSA